MLLLLLLLLLFQGRMLLMLLVPMHPHMLLMCVLVVACTQMQPSKRPRGSEGVPEGALVQFPATAKERRYCRPGRFYVSCGSAIHS